MSRSECMNNVIRNVFDHSFWFEEMPRFQKVRTPVADIKDLGNKLAIDIKILVVDRGETELKLTKKILEISVQEKRRKKIERRGMYLSERDFSAFRKNVLLPVEVVPEKAEVSFKKGILYIEVPKARPESRGRN